MSDLRNLSNGTNNHSNKNGGMIIMTHDTSKTMEAFAGTIKAAMENIYGEGYRVELTEVVKNNSCLTGLYILKDGDNMAPTIHLDGFFEDYKKGTFIKQICSEVARIYEDNKVEKVFDVSGIMDYQQMKDRICYKLVNAKRNQKLLADAPHIVFHDLAIIFFILVSKDTAGTGTITVRNNIKDMWSVDADELYTIALRNTQRLFRGKVSTMASVISEILSDNMNDEFSGQFFNIEANTSDMMPMYVVTNADKINGAGVIFYENLLKEFAERIGYDFFILPSSIHETLFVPAFSRTDARELVAMVREVNATQVAADEILSDNVYIYNRETDRVEMV